MLLNCAGWHPWVSVAGFIHGDLQWGNQWSVGSRGTKATDPWKCWGTQNLIIMKSFFWFYNALSILVASS
jgi:hypothetical protein